MDNIDSKTFLLIGGAGFIGSHLADFLLKNKANRVIILDNFFLGSKDNLSFASRKYPNKLSIIEGDACNYGLISKIIEKYTPEIVVNLATKALLHSFVDPADAYKVNTDIILNLLEPLRENKYKKLVHISTSEVFGTAEYVPMDENHPRKPETTYAAGKAAADLAVESYINMFNVNAVILRPFNNYGPRQNPNSLAAVIPKTVKSIMLGGAPIIEGDGLQTRDFIYVEDTVRVISQFFSFDRSPLTEYNIGSGEETTIKEIIEVISSIMGCQQEIQYVPARLADVRRHMADISRLEMFSGVISLMPLKRGLEITIQSYLESTSVL